MTSLDLALIYLIAAVLGVVVCRTYKLPPILGYLVVGIVIGPNALAFDQDTSSVRHLAEFGVVFLMFVIGLEFNLAKLKAMRNFVFGLGFMQVAVSIALVIVGSIVLGFIIPHYWNLPWQSSFALGGALAMSSTAIVVKLVQERGELHTLHGQRVIGVLLFQDLAVVPLMILTPALGSEPEKLAIALLWAVLKASILIGVLLTGGQRIMHWWLTLVARYKNEELFVLNVLLVTLGLAWITEHAGLSLALGAFIAGMLISETEYKHQVEADIKPFHDVLLGLFFITIGMMLDWKIVLQNWYLVLLMTIFPLLFKFALVAILCLYSGATRGVSIRTGIHLAQAGEFGFVLLGIAQQVDLIPPHLLNPILASMVISMMATPLLIERHQWIVNKLVPDDWMDDSLRMAEIASRSVQKNEHVIICGYGRCGQNLASMLKQQNITYMALDMDPDRVQEASAAGDVVVFGDSTRLPSLMAAGLARASAVVVTYLETSASLKVLKHVRDHAPHVPVVVRTQDDTDLEVLQQAGATEVVPESIEGSIVLASQALVLLGTPIGKVVQIVQQQRKERYQLMRSYFHGRSDDTFEEAHHERLCSIHIVKGAAAKGKPLSSLELNALEVDTANLRRMGRNIPIDEYTILQAGDVLVLAGKPDALFLAEKKILEG